MAWTIEKTDGGAFLPFVDMKDMMLSEFARRLGENLEGRVDYGELIFVPGFDFKNLREEKSLDGEKSVRHSADNIPFWCRCAMVEPFFVHFDSICPEILGSILPHTFSALRFGAGKTSIYKSKGQDISV